MPKALLVSFITAITLLSASGLYGQERTGFGGVHSFGLSATYSPDSSHILIGNSRERRVWTADVEYTHLLHKGRQFRLDYEGSVTPLFLESDPTVTATVFNSAGQNIVTQQTPERVLLVDHSSVGNILTANNVLVPLYAIYGRQNTYAAGISPLGARLSAFPRSRLQPSMALDLGFLVAARDIPLNDCAQFNYTFAIGPGIQFFADRRTSYRLEYLYRHVSNAGQGAQNPGIDQGVLRLTVSLHH